jgi:hypothetical protein
MLYFDASAYQEDFSYSGLEGPQALGPHTAPIDLETCLAKARKAGLDVVGVEFGQDGQIRLLLRGWHLVVIPGGQNDR